MVQKLDVDRQTLMDELTPGGGSRIYAQLRYGRRGSQYSDKCYRLLLPIKSAILSRADDQSRSTVRSDMSSTAAVSEVE